MEEETIKIKSIFEHIVVAQKQAIKEKIQANTIIIDTAVAKTNHIYINDVLLNFVEELNPMVLGLKMEYDDNCSELFGSNFVLARKEKPKEKTLSDYTTDELLDEIRRRTL